MKRNNEKKNAKGKNCHVLHPSRQINHCKGKKLIKMGLGFRKMKKN